MIDILIGLSLLVGVFFALIASLGILRLPDLYTRMHAATKAGTAGMGFVLLAVAVFFGELGVVSRVLGTLLFIFLTAPIGAHLLGKAMLQRGYEIWRPEKNHVSESDR